jgi:hypothetical protein
MTYKPGKPNDDIGRAKPFWEEVPDKAPPKYEPPKNELQKPFWDEKTEPRKPIAFAALLFILIAIGAASLWL